MNIKKIILPVFWVFAIIFFECVYRMTIFKNIIDSNFIEMIVFCIPISILLYLLSSIFSEKTNKIINTSLLLIIYFIFFAQMVYFKVYGSVFSIYSMTNGGQVFEFWRTILSTIIDNNYCFICLTVPLVVYFILKKTVLTFEKNSLNFRLPIIILYFASFIISLSYLSFDKNSIYSSYNLFFNTHAPILSAKKFGLITSMYLDLDRTLFGMKKNELKITIDNSEMEEPKKEIIYNNLDIDFESLISNEDDEQTVMMHRFFESREGTKKNEYTGMFEGKNVIFMLAESLDPIAIDEQLTPTLYKLANSGFNFTNYYAPLYPASTADGEFRTEWSLISSRGDTLTLYSAKDIYSPYIFANSYKDYNINIYHNYDGDYYNRREYFKSLNYKNFKACNYGLKLPCDSFHESDLDMVNKTMNEYINSDELFFTYYITLSGHLSYTRHTNKIADKNWELVKDLPYSEKVKGYIAGNIELDKALESLINELEKNNKLDDTVIIITPDHYPYGLSAEQINEVSKVNRDDNFELHHSDLIIWNNEMNETITIDKVGSNNDVLPTMLNLFGIDYDSRLIMGKDLLSDSEGLVILSNRSWISDIAKYNSTDDSVISLIDEPIEEAYINKINNEVDNQFKISYLILENNYYKKVFKTNNDLNEEDK